MTIINFQTSIYWGQLSNCTKYVQNISQYSCSNTTAYAFTSAFSVFLFLIQAIFSYSIYIWRGALIDETDLYENIDQNVTSNINTSSSSSTSSATPIYGKFNTPNRVTI
jgi:hypothetical protein